MRIFTFYAVLKSYIVYRKSDQFYDMKAIGYSRSVMRG